MRRTIHLIGRPISALVSLRCLACGEVARTQREGEKVNRRSTPAVCLNRSDWETIYLDHTEYRRCIDDPDDRDRPKTAYQTPTEAGWYWAEWRISEDGTFENERDDTTPQHWPEVVEVFDRGSLDEPELRAAVAGVRKSQGIDCFVWRSGKLEAPK